MTYKIYIRKVLVSMPSFEYIFNSILINLAVQFCTALVVNTFLFSHISFQSDSPYVYFCEYNNHVVFSCLYHSVFSFLCLFIRVVVSYQHPCSQHMRVMQGQREAGHDALLFRQIARDLLHALSQRHDNTGMAFGELVIGTGGNELITQ